jgi:hypothetical protein
MVCLLHSSRNDQRSVLYLPPTEYQVRIALLITTMWTVLGLIVLASAIASLLGN